MTSRHVVVLFAAICLFRISNTTLVRSYFDPDEFWQTMEPAYCEAFMSGTATSSKMSDRYQCPGYTWEWKRRAPPATKETSSFLSWSSALVSLMLWIEQCMWGPARAYLSVLPTYFYFRFVRWIHADTYWVVSRGPMCLCAVLVAAPTDLAIWYSARWLDHGNDVTDNKNKITRQSSAGWCLFCSLSSWFHAYTLVRTFANGQETLLLALAISLVSPELLSNQHNVSNRLLRSCAAFFLGGLSMSIRFTSLAAFVPIGALLAIQEQSLLQKLQYLFFPCACWGAAGTCAAMLVDRIFFGFWTIPFLANFHFNVILDNAGLYGSHPWHWYWTAGLPAVTGLLLPFLIQDLGDTISKRKPNSGKRNLWIVLVCYLSVMSFNAHKEFRYILPILPIACLLCGHRVRTAFVGISKGRSRPILCSSMFAMSNLIALIYLGLFHQRGPISVNQAIVQHSTALYRHNQDRPNVLSIHYLTGGCHTTPLHSHLHAPPLVYETWSLDCSPDCRADPIRLCESEQFHNAPDRFIDRVYAVHSAATTNTSTGTCQHSTSSFKESIDNSCVHQQSPWHEWPDYLVTMSRYLDRVESQIVHIAGYHELARFPHHLNGVRIGSVSIGEQDNIYTSSHEIFDWLTLKTEDVVLFTR